MKLFLQIIACVPLIFFDVLHAQPKADESTVANVNGNNCISGDCLNGIGKLLRNPSYDDYIMLLKGHFKNGSLNGEGEVFYFTKDKHDTLFSYTGKFVDGLLVFGSHSIYGQGSTPSSIQKDEGTFNSNYLMEGKITFNGYGALIDGSYTVKRDNGGKCISGNCKEGEGLWVKIDVDYYGCTFTKKTGKFKNGTLIAGNIILDGYEYESFKNGVYTIGDWKMQPDKKNYFAKAVFKPKNDNEQIMGIWGKPDNVNEYPFVISANYTKKPGKGDAALSSDKEPMWIKKIYQPFLNMQDSLLALNKKLIAKLIESKKEKKPTVDFCAIFQGGGRIDSGKYFMGRKIPIKCPCCNGYGKTAQQVGKLPTQNMHGVRTNQRSAKS